MSVAAPDGDNLLTVPELGRSIPEPITETTVEPPPPFPVRTPPADKLFRLHPEWAQKGPFW
jgi:hypothetical protein